MAPWGIESAQATPPESSSVSLERRRGDSLGAVFELHCTSNFDVTHDPRGPMTRVRVSMLAAVVLVPLTTGAFLIERRPARDSARLFDQVLSLVSDRFVDTVPSADLYEKAARGLVREINDPYAALYSPKQLAEFTASTGGRYAGLGMLVEDQQGVTVVSRVYPAHAGRGGRRARRRPHCRGRESGGTRVEAAAGDGCAQGKSGHAGERHLRATGRDVADRAQAHARDHPHSRGAVHDSARRQDRLSAAPPVQRDLRR